MNILFKNSRLLSVFLSDWISYQFPLPVISGNEKNVYHDAGPVCDKCLTTSTQFHPRGRSSLARPP